MGKNSNKTNVKIVKNSKKESDRAAAIKELEEKIGKMKEDRDNKCKAAKTQLVEMLEVTADKYRTATGTVEALRTMRQIYGNNERLNVYTANDLAWRMAKEASLMCDKAKKLDTSEMDKLCENFYLIEFSFDEEEPDPEVALAYELMRLDLCRNVGGAAEDMVSFVKRVDEEIESTKKALAELCNNEEVQND